MQKLSERGDDRDFSLALPRDVLADIIVNFLGQRERLSFSKETFFILDLNDLRQFYLLLDAKISKEVNTRLEFFQAAINYDDDTSRTLTSFESLEKFHETRNVVPTGVTLTWHLVFRFPDAPTIETQKINLSFLIAKGFIDGRVQLSIEHSNPVWGIEVLNLLSNQIRKKLGRLPRFISFWRVFFDATSIRFLAGFGAQFMMVAMFSLALILLGFISHYVPGSEPASHMYETTSESESPLKKLFYSGQLSERELIILSSLMDGKRDAYITDVTAQPSLSIDLRKGLTDYLAAREHEKNDRERTDGETRNIVTQTIIVIVVTATLIWLSLWSWLQYHRQRSFLLLTDEARAARDRFLQAKRNHVTLGIGGMVVAILTAIIANYLSAWLMK
ncbi:hypothetical protein [uncultured Thiodictyon sp.]|jgi:hypothetical protein|uniref:hypothetical protein n=1 Tax=uncultured Thiodictyon sp. TaxID=1846217 RepID=UPI0025DC996E|nr:hypothetical protein [uncultured Thiodictyon sp.]